MARDAAAILQKVVGATARGEIPIAHRHPLGDPDRAHYAIHAGLRGRVVLLH